MSKYSPDLRRVRRAAIGLWRNVLTAERQSVLTVRTWCCGQSFCEVCGDCHAAHSCVRKPVQNEPYPFRLTLADVITVSITNAFNGLPIDW